MRQLILGILISFIFLNNSCYSQNKMKITPLVMLTEFDTMKIEYKQASYRFDYYMIEGIDDNQIRQSIYDYVIKHIDSSFLRLDQYEMVFYRKSSNVNLENIMNTPENLRYKTVLYDKPVAEYIWFHGKLCKECIDRRK